MTHLVPASRVSILSLSYCNIVGNGTLACLAFQAFLPWDYATPVREMNFGWCMTLKWTHKGSLYSVWDTNSFPLSFSSYLFSGLMVFFFLFKCHLTCLLGTKGNTKLRTWCLSVHSQNVFLLCSVGSICVMVTRTRAKIKLWWPAMIKAYSSSDHMHTSVI